MVIITPDQLLEKQKQAIRNYLKVRGSKDPKIATITDLELLIDMAVRPERYKK